MKHKGSQRHPKKGMIQNMYTQPLITYVIKPGDTIYKLAERFHSSEYAILSANPGIYPYNLVTGQIVAIPVENSGMTQNQGNRNTAPAGITANQMNLISDLRKLWMEHVFWTRLAIISMVNNLPDQTPVTNRLLRNATDMAAALRPIYGDAVATKFGSLISEHLTIAAQLVNAAKQGDTEAAQRAEKAWYANADQIAAYLSSINPYISKEDFKNMFYNHLALTKAEAAAEIKKDYVNSIALFDQIEKQALTMADTMSGGIIRQFPGTFA